MVKKLQPFGNICIVGGTSLLFFHVNISGKHGGLTNSNGYYKTCA